MSIDDHHLAARLAETAGRVLLAVRDSALLDGKPVGAAGDVVSNAFLIDLLRRLRPDDAILSEEEKDNPARLRADRVWVVDPLDGTREYGEQRTDWAVHVALTIGGVPDASAVALPGLGLTLSTAHPPALTPAGQGQTRILVSRSRPPQIASTIAERLGAVLLPMGSAGAKTMGVVRGEADAYVHADGQYEWDSCAPAGVAAAAGLHVSRLDGSPLRYNRPNPYLPDLLVCRKELAPAILDIVKSEGFTAG